MKCEKLDENYSIEISIERFPCLQVTFRVFTISKHRIDREQVGYAYVDVYTKGTYNLPRKSAIWTDIVITEKYYRQGMGSKIVKFAIAYLRKIGIEQIFGKISVTDDTKRAIAFWRKNGFKIIMYEKPEGDVARIKLQLAK